MTPWEEALLTARKLDAHGVRFVVIGSTERALRGAVLAAPPADVDLVLDDAAILARACDLLVADGFALEVWGEPLVAFDPARLAGKIYVRARRGQAQLDVMFPPLPDGFPDLRPLARRIGGLDVATTGPRELTRVAAGCT